MFTVPQVSPEFNSVEDPEWASVYVPKDLPRDDGPEFSTPSSGVDMFQVSQVSPELNSREDPRWADGDMTEDFPLDDEDSEFSTPSPSTDMVPVSVRIHLILIKPWS